MQVPEFIYTVVFRPRPLRSAVNSLIRKCIPEQVTRHGAVIVLNPNDPVVCGALTFGVYEAAETDFLLNVFRPGMTFVDVGANIGYYTALAIDRIGVSGRIIAIEPEPENFEYLNRTVRANRAKHVVCVRKGASDQEGRLTLYTSSGNRGDNRLYRNDLADGSYEVETSTLDTILDEQGILSADLIKIDVQGFEGQVLRGMRQTLRRSGRLVMLLEFWPFGLECAGTRPLDFLNELEAGGLELFELAGKRKLQRLKNKPDLIARYSGRRYANLVAARPNALPATPAPHA
jgi:FkbM family methyltransferase